MPPWINYVVQLTPAFITGVLGLFGLWFARLQYRINKDKLRLDLFEKRFDAYEALQGCFGSVFREGDFKVEAITKLHEARYKCRFLFGEDIRSHIEELWKRGFEMQKLRDKLYGPESLPVGPERSEISRQHTEILKWFLDQMQTSPDRFKSYLQFG